MSLLLVLMKLAKSFFKLYCSSIFHICIDLFKRYFETGFRKIRWEINDINGAIGNNSNIIIIIRAPFQTLQYNHEVVLCCVFSLSQQGVFRQADILCLYGAIAPFCLLHHGFCDLVDDCCYRYFNGSSSWSSPPQGRRHNIQKEYYSLFN